MLQCRRMWERLLVTFILRRTIAHCTVVERDRSSVLDLLAISSFTVRLSLCANNVYIVVDFVFTRTPLECHSTGFTKSKSPADVSALRTTVCGLWAERTLNQDFFMM